MEKYGVVNGTVKTAAADNEGDPVGTAAKCIADARKTVQGLSELARSINGKGEPEKPESKPE